MELLARDQFRDAVFKRDANLCVICHAAASDAHHIMERRLFDDGGYYLDNGASLCANCHVLAEQTTLSCAAIRAAAGLEQIALPPHLYPDNVYDKWGNIIMPNGSRIKGELFGDESVQKILRAGGVSGQFRKYVKYPRTYHLPWSPGATDDDRVLTDEELEANFSGRMVVATEKMDGENTTMYGPSSFSTHGDLVLDPDGRLYGAAQSDGRGRNGGMIFEISTNAIRKPAALPTCQFTPSSETETLSWAFYGTQGFSETFYYNVPPGDTGFCWVPKASYTASWLSNVTPAQGYEVGSGENYITFYTAENTSTAPRAAQIRLGSGFVLTLKQSGYPTISCQYNPPSGTLQVGSVGGNSGILYANAAVPQGHDGCIVYAPTSKATWISNLSPTTNQANGGAPLVDEFSFDVAANSGPARSAIVRLGKGFALIVKQDAGN